MSTPAAPDGIGVVSRGSSRVLEIDPVTLKKIWEYSIRRTESYRFFSHYVSSAQRLSTATRSSRKARTAGCLK